ncbi:hypothetical protein GC106_86420 [Kibdelosporangium sp. 4NS15]|uniref:Nitroreductase domain-containing protein n=1 Tax=Kibdelosporangium persicum TaxID=2698649 RepID=A0ABX2FJ83_9PSEU|nr:hypothetical protein [Kibdelosporangium persicum]
MPAGLAAAVARLENAIGRRPGSAKRGAPSAGACYPYEVLVAPLGVPVCGVVDLQQRKVVIRSAERAHWDGDAFAYFLIGRPWLSMRKYGRRGYFYHLLDAGHALLNLSLAAADSAPGFRLETQITELAAEHASARAGAVLAAGVIDRTTTAAPGWMLQETVDTRMPLSDVESLITELLPPAPQPVRLHRLETPEAGELAGGLASRRSASALAGMPDADGLGEVLGRIEEYRHRLVPAFGMPVPQIKVFSRHPGIGGELPSTKWLAEAVLGQSDLLNASTFVAIHAQVRDKGLVALSSEAQRTIMAGGVTGEIGYLVCALSGVDMTGVGGYDPAMWARLCDTEDDVLFVLAIGQELPGEKADVTSTGGNHIQ